MRKIGVLFVFIALCVLPAALYAANEATDKGSVAFDAGTALSFQIFSGDSDGTVLAVGSGSSLNVSYFIVDNLSLGGTLEFASVKPSGADASTLFSIGPQVNYYMPLKKELMLDIKGFVAFDSFKDPGFDAETQLFFGGGAGLMYLLNSNLGVYGGADLTLALDKRQGGTNIGDGYFEIGIGVGFKVFL